MKRDYHKEAREYFGVYGNNDYVLHHKDKTLKYTDPERYAEWRIEDLEVMTREEHNKVHIDDNDNFKYYWKGKQMTEESNKKRSEALTGKKNTAEHNENISKGKTGKKRAPFSEEWKANIGKAKKGKHRKLVDGKWVWYE